MQPYSIVVATRNRLDDLLQSIPSFLDQSISAKEIIVVDSSDDHNKVVEGLSRLKIQSETDVIVIKSQRGLPIQRNLGLHRVSTGIVFYPDDDSLWFKDTAEQQLKVYLADPGNRVSGVCGREVLSDPRSTSSPANYCDQRQLGFAIRVRSKLESKLFHDPIQTIGEEYIRNAQFKTSLPEVKKVAFMTGFRMSFRTDVIRKFGFDESLLGYAPFEDIDASFGAWRYGAVVAATSAMVYHNKNSSRRGDGYTIGAMHLLNRAYVVAKHTVASHPSRKHLVAFSYYKVGLYAIAAKGRYERARLKGATMALKWVRLLAAAEPGRSKENYLSARTALFRNT